MQEEGDGLSVTEMFDERLAVYQAVLAHDLMEHREISAALGAWLRRRFAEPFSVLEVGCGDGSVTARTLAGLPVRSYTGVDLSASGLAHAAERFATAGVEARFERADMLEFVRAARGSWDVLLASFVLHHLPPASKRAFMIEAARVVAPGGALLLVDVFRREGETREAYLGRYLPRLRETWAVVGRDGVELAVAHVSEHDFPEPEVDVRDWAAAAGFAAPERLYAGIDDMQRALAFER